MNRNLLGGTWVTMFEYGWSERSLSALTTCDCHCICEPLVPLDFPSPSSGKPSCHGFAPTATGHPACQPQENCAPVCSWPVPSPHPGYSPLSTASSTYFLAGFMLKTKGCVTRASLDRPPSLQGLRWSLHPTPTYFQCFCLPDLMIPVYVWPLQKAHANSHQLHFNLLCPHCYWTEWGHPPRASRAKH